MLSPSTPVSKGRRLGLVGSPSRVLPALAALLAQYVLGVRPLDPGYSRFRVGPHPGSLGHVEGRVPTPRGPILAKLDRVPEGLRCYLEAPEGTEAVVEAPAGYETWEGGGGDRGGGAEGGAPLTLPPGTNCLMARRLFG